MHLFKFGHCHQPHLDMDNEIQRSPVTLAEVDEAHGCRAEVMHLESDSKLWGAPTAHQQFTDFTCLGVQKHGCYCACACNPIYWDTHQGNDKESRPTGSRHVLWLVNAHSHQRRLGDQRKHYASVCCWSRRTQENDAHVIGRVG